MDSDILTGLILGDGSLSKVKNGKSRLQVGSNKSEYLKWLSGEVGGTVSYSHTSKSGKEVEQLKTKSTAKLASWRRKWYPNGEKIIPGDINFNDTIIRFWFVGDGSLVKPRQGDTPYITIYNSSLDSEILYNKLTIAGYEPSSYDENRVTFDIETAAKFWENNNPVPGYRYKWPDEYKS